MARKLASIVEIEKCEPIPNTDRLSVATMKGKGWQVVVGRDEFKPGSLCVYFEIDSFLNPNDERYEFLRERCLRRFVSKGGNVVREGIRIKTIKLRGVVSQGLLMPLDKFPEVLARVTNKIVLGDGSDTIAVSAEEGGGCIIQPLIGADVTSILGVEHYDEVREQIQPALGNPISADAMGPFPALIPKTDEERIQNLGDWFETMKGRRWQVTVKHDGTSCTIAYSPSIDENYSVVVCSRNQRLKPITASGKEPVYWQMARKYDIPGKALTYLAINGKEIAFQGEVVGPGIQSDRNKEKDHEFRCFRIWNITDQTWFSPMATEKICKDYDIPHVQIVERSFPFFDEITTMEEALKFAEGKTAEGNEREGVVLKTVDNLPYASFKIVSNRYLMKQED